MPVSASSLLRRAAHAAKVASEPRMRLNGCGERIIAGGGRRGLVPAWTVPMADGWEDPD